MERLAEVAASHFGLDRVPGVVALLASGNDVRRGAGCVVHRWATVRRDSLFRIALTMETISGAVTMALDDEGLLSLDEAVTRLLPELASPGVLRRMDGPLDDIVATRRESPCATC